MPTLRAPNSTLGVSVSTLQQLVIELNKTDTEQLDAPADVKQLEDNTPSFLRELGVAHPQDATELGVAHPEDATEPFEVVDAFTDLAQVSDTNAQG